MSSTQFFCIISYELANYQNLNHKFTDIIILYSREPVL